MSDDPSAQIAELRRQVDRLEAERGILRLFHEYGPALDYGNEEAWVALFTDDGVFDIPTPEPARYFAGREQLLAFARQHTRAPANVHKHCVFDSLIEVDGDEATSISYFARLDLRGDGPTVKTIGRYHDRLVRVDDGSWRFRYRRPEIEAMRA